MAAVLPIAVLAGGPASAHVTVDSPDAAQGGWATIAFTVPTESEDASTTEIEVRLPEGADLEHLSTRTKPGWDVTVEPGRTITWTATDGGIAPGEFDVFEVRGGPLPSDVDSLEFVATQHYSDGTVVAWDESATEGGEEPQRPAPTLPLAPADETADHHATDATDSDATGGSQQAASEDTGGVDGVLLGATALALAGIALVAAVRRRRTSR
ncbi:UNVERIFIED_CONTAM: hypothetical protein LK11_43220 [Mumia flava]